MAKYFLGSVGKAEAFKRDDNGDLQLAFVSKTLTDSGLNISTTKDDIRAGEGAPIQFSFYHDSNVEITLTDVQWKTAYLEAQLGANFQPGSEDYVTDEVEFTNGVASYAKTINKMPLPCGEEYVVWGAKQGSDEWFKISYDATGKTLTVVSEGGSTVTSANGTWCVRYLGPVNNAKVAEITSTIIPQELFLIITAPIFAGDACAASKGRAAGHITFEVPRFQLNGAQEFAMNMSQNQTMSLAGVALASESLDCDAQGGKLLRIIEVITNYDWRNDVVSLIVDGQSQEIGDKPSIYAELKSGLLKPVDTSVTPALVEYTTDAGANWSDLGSATVFAAGTYKFRLKGFNAVSDSVTIS